VVAVSDLRARCALLPRGTWQDCLLDALSGLAASREAAVDLADLAVAGPLLRTRVCIEGSPLLDEVVRRPIADGLVEVLYAQVRGAAAIVPPHVAARWDVPVELLLDRGRAQVLDVRPDREDLDLDAVTVVALSGSAPWRSAWLHRLDELLDVPAAGALVALPTQHLLLVAPLETRTQAVDVAQLLLLNADRIWTAGPAALSPDLWWWRGGRLVHLPGTTTSLSPPLEFVQVLDALPA
jgi:hypothetical protein